MEPRNIGSCGTLTNKQICDMRKLGDYDCNTEITKNDAVQFIYKYIDGHISKKDATDKIYSYLDFVNDDNNYANLKRKELQQIASDTSKSAENQLNDMNNKDFGIANIPINDNTGNYDIFFKGKEVLEYRAKIIMSDENLSVSDASVETIHPIFKNLFNDDRYNSHIINGTQLYHARKASLDDDWETDTVYKIFSKCNFKIESIDGIRYHDTNNDTRVENLRNGSSVYIV
tara:strand:- start:94 stop:783 length:690 start_codon:yes stop_codon:yes gene_type:complete